MNISRIVAAATLTAAAATTLTACDHRDDRGREDFAEVKTRHDIVLSATDKTRHDKTRHDVP